jgi:hypothetical protein
LYFDTPEKMTYYPPEFKKSAFNYPYCGAYAKQHWRKIYTDSHIIVTRVSAKTTCAISMSACENCGELAYWYRDRLIVPSTGTVEPPHPDLPEDCKMDYLEARDIVNSSPRGAAALLRLCLQKLMIALGKKGKNLNDDIAELVKEGLPLIIQQSLDICRVVGNNAVHPGELDLNDNPEMANSLFTLINLIVRDRITQPKEIQALYESLPKGSINAIEKRDGEKL